MIKLCISFKTSPVSPISLLLVSHLQEDGFLVIIWNAAEFYTQMRLSTWGIHKKFLSLTQQEKACLYVRELGWAFRFYFLVVHLYLSTSPKVLLTNPVKQSVLCTESRSFHPYSSKQFLPLTQAPDELGFLPLRCIRTTMKCSPGRSSAVTTLLALMCVLLYSWTVPALPLFLSIIGIRQAGSSGKIFGMRIL